MITKLESRNAKAFSGLSPRPRITAGHNRHIKMVLLERIELSTSPLPRECSTSELQQRRARLTKCNLPPVQAQSGRKSTAALEDHMTGKTQTNAGGKKTPTRDERLKSALKANLARRKAQARARSAEATEKTGEKED